jgi:paraquat-inducible protein A
VTTARALGLLGCHTCGLVSRGAGAAHPACPRCGTRLHARKPDSLARTWALLLAATVLYVPANVLPIMHTASLFGTQSDTIMSGVVYLWVTGSWPLAVVVFVASVFVPLAKLLALAYLAATVQRGTARAPAERLRLYRMVEIVGRWSMLDVFVVALLAALVQLRSLAEIVPGPGATAFGAVVVLTMLAAMTFDPRLIWDGDTGDGGARTERPVNAGTERRGG